MKNVNEERHLIPWEFDLKKKGGRENSTAYAPPPGLEPGTP